MTTELQAALSDGEMLAMTTIQGALNYLAQAQRLTADEIRALLEEMIDQLPGEDGREPLPVQWLN